LNGAVIETTDSGERKTLFTDVFAYRDGKCRLLLLRNCLQRSPDHPNHH
jgi:hypothetical protein